MRNPVSTDRSTATWLVETSRIFFAWLIERPAKRLEPYKENVVVRNIPNAISVWRCVMAVWVDWQIYQAPTAHERWLSLGIIVVLIASDGIDGALARRLKLESRFGAMADPFADKILIGGLLIGLAFKVRCTAVCRAGPAAAGHRAGQRAGWLHWQPIGQTAGQTRTGRLQYLGQAQVWRRVFTRPARLDAASLPGTSARYQHISHHHGDSVGGEEPPRLHPDDQGGSGSFPSQKSHCRLKFPPPTRETNGLPWGAFRLVRLPRNMVYFKEY